MPKHSQANMFAQVLLYCQLKRHQAPGSLNMNIIFGVTQVVALAEDQTEDIKAMKQSRNQPKNECTSELQT